MSEPIIAVDHITKQVADATGTLTILDDISFQLRERESVAIVGQLLGIQQQNLGLDYVQKRNSLVEAVTLDQVKAQARRLLHPDRLIVTVVGKPEGLK